MKKILKISLISILSILVLGVVSFFILFHNEIRTLTSVNKIDDYGFYEVTVYSDYALDNLIADGGASTDAELTNYLIKSILKGLPVTFEIPDFGCSTFQAITEDGDYIFGRNYDLDPVPSMLIRTKPKNGYQSISIANASVVGYKVGEEPSSLISKLMVLAAPYAVMDGMNEKGLSIGVLLIKDEPTNQTTDKPDITTTSMIRLVLDKAANVDEAIDLFAAYDMHASANASYHYQIADANGNSAVIEYVDHKLNIIKKERETPLALTNFLISEEKYGFGTGHDRYDLLMNKLNKTKGILSMSDAMALLQTVSQNKTSDEGRITATQWSAVYNNTKRTVDIVINNNFDKVYSYSLFE